MTGKGGASTSSIDGESDSRSADDRILDIVVHMLETDGYDAVQLREVAKRSRTSLATIYKRYATRDDLILAALQAWLDENRYAKVSRRARAADETVYDAMAGLFRTIFEPW